MKTLDEIKQMMAAGEAAQADEALEELLAAKPNNLQAKMLYGTCRQLLGDEETFKRIHDELAPEMENVPSQTADTEMWIKYKTFYSDILCTRLLTEEDGGGFHGICNFCDIDIACPICRCCVFWKGDIESI